MCVHVPVHVVRTQYIYYHFIANEMSSCILKFLLNYRCYNRCLSDGWPGSPMIWVSTLLYYDDDDCFRLCSYLMGWVGLGWVVLYCIVLYCILV